MPYTNPAATVFAPTTGGGAPRGADMGDAQLWGTEVEQAIKQAVGAAHKARLVAVTNVSVISGLQPGTSLDGKVLVKGDPVLLTGQTAPAQNGLYIVPTLGDAPSRAWAFSYYDSMPGTFFIVIEGTTYGQTIWRCTSVMGGTLGVTALAFSAELARANTWAGVQTFSAVPVLSGGGIKFPATQVPSADVNTLDDYEEGTWTPTITFVTPGNLAVTYTAQTGTYVKIGKVVVYSYLITTSSFTHTTASGLLYISGLPFGTASNFNGSGSCSMSGYTKAGYTPFGHETGSAGQTRLYIQVGGSGLALTDIGVADVPTGGTIRLYGSGTYIAA